MQVNESNYGEFSSPNIPSCPSDATFRPKCTVHMLRWSLKHLFDILQDYILPKCSFCKHINETSRGEVEEFPEMVGNLTTRLVPSSCVSIHYIKRSLLLPTIVFFTIDIIISFQRKLFAAISNLSTPCNVVYELHQRLENLTLWQDISLSSINNSFPEVTEVIERLRGSVLPITAQALVSDCTNCRSDYCSTVKVVLPQLI